MPPALLEYDESDDLFDPTEINPSAPISGPSTSSTFHPSAPPRTTSTTRSGFSGNNPSSSTPVPKPSAYPHLPSPWAQNRIATEDGEEIVVDHHYVAALKRRRDKVGEWAVRDVGGEDGRGVRSLKRMCIDLCKIHSARMFDIGDVPYSLVSEFVDIMPVEQLAQVEDASPHLRKDTDWLYELPLHSLFPSFHLSVLLKKGVKRTSGWRRMYKLAGEEAAEKQRNAEARMAERYAELERERERKKVKVLDRAPVGVGGMRRVGGGGVYGREKGPVIKQGSGSFGKLKAESQRINLALKRTLAANASASASSSNRPSIPSTSTTSSSRPISSSTPSSRPPSSHASNVNGNRAPPVAARSVSGPPIPAPRRRAARAQAQAAEARAALPAHLRSATAENVAAKQAGRSMGITDVQPVKPVKSTSAPVSRGAAATSSSSSAVRAVKAGRRGGAAITVGPSASASATGSSMMSGLSSSFQPRNPTSTRIASSTKPPVLDTRTSPATISSSYQPRSAMRQAPLPSASAPTSTPASRQCHTSAPSSAPQSTSALKGSTKRKAEIIDLDAIPPPSLSSATSSAAAANGRSGTAGNTAGMARRLDPVRDKEKLEGVLFRKKPRVGSGGVSKGKIRQ